MHGSGFRVLIYAYRESMQWDYTSSVEEVMNNLHALVMARKVLYLVREFLDDDDDDELLRVLNWAEQGISDTPAWVVVKANSYARTHGKTPFSIYQGSWNILMRDMEREVIPMCQDQGTFHVCSECGMQCADDLSASPPFSFFFKDLRSPRITCWLGESSIGLTLRKRGDERVAKRVSLFPLSKSICDFDLRICPAYD